MYKLESFTGNEAKDFALEKEKKDKKQFKKMRMSCNFLSVILLVALTYINPNNFKWFFLIYGLGTGVMGNWAISHIKKREERITQEIREGKAQYVYVDGLKYNEEQQFETVEGNVIERSFSKDAYGKYQNVKFLYIIYIPAMNTWCVDK